MLKKLDDVHENYLYSFIGGAFFMAAMVVIPYAVAFGNSTTGIYGLLCLAVSLYFITQVKKHS